MKKIKFLLKLLIVMLGVNYSYLFALTLGVKSTLTNSPVVGAGQTLVNLDSSMTNFNVHVESDYCLRNDNTSDTGIYYFELVVLDATGLEVHSTITSKSSLPRFPQKLNASFTVPLSAPSSFGFYHVKAIYHEEKLDSSKIISQAVDKYINYTNLGVYDISQRNLPVSLISPINDMEVFDVLPQFTWSSFVGNFPVTYTLWISENEDPTRGYIFKKTGITTNIFRYPVDAQKFKAGAVYYWKIRALDSNNQPAFGIDGHTDIGRFQVSDALYGRVETLYPKDQVVSLATESFTWTSGIAAAYYKVTIGTDEALQSIIWQGDQNQGTNTISIPVQEISEAKSASILYWKVIAYNNTGTILGQSKIARFEFNAASLSISEELSTNGKTGVKGLVRNLVSDVLPNSYIVILPEATLGKLTQGYQLKQDADGRFYSITSDGVLSYTTTNSGTYSVDLDPGKYEIWFYKDNYVTAKELITIRAGKVCYCKSFLNTIIWIIIW